MNSAVLYVVLAVATVVLVASMLGFALSGTREGQWMAVLTGGLGIMAIGAVVIIMLLPSMVNGLGGAR